MTLTKTFRCKVCKSSFPSKSALRQHSRSKHRIRTVATMASYSFVAVGLVVFLTYSGLFASLSQAVAPPVVKEGSLQEVVMHIHPKLQIIIDGRQVTIPSNMGILWTLWKDRSLERLGMPMPDMRDMPFMSPLHTHDTSGIIHVESTVIRNYTLGEFFDVWGVSFNESCILDRCGGSIVVYVNGVKFESGSSDFRELIFVDGQQIRIEYRSTR